MALHFEPVWETRGILNLQDREQTPGRIPTSVLPPQRHWRESCPFISSVILNCDKNAIVTIFKCTEALSTLMLLHNHHHR